MLTRFTKHWPFWIWVLIFVLMCFTGFWGRSQSDFWHSWEYAALGSTVLYTVLFYIMGFFFRRKWFRTIPHGFLGALLPCMLIVVGSLGYATWISYKSGECNWQLFYLVVGSIFFLLISLIMAFKSNDEAVREDFYMSFKLNDTPVAVAFSLLLLYSYLFHKQYGGEPIGGNHAQFEPQIRAFIGGAIAFQMIVSNWIFALLFRTPGVEFPEAVSNNGGQ